MNHKTITLTNPLYNSPVEIDEKIAPIVKLLWRRGVMLWGSCQERGDGYAYVSPETALDMERAVDVLSELFACDLDDDFKVVVWQNGDAICYEIHWPAVWSDLCNPELPYPIDVSGSVDNPEAWIVNHRQTVSKMLAH